MTSALILAAGVSDLAVRRPGRSLRWTLVLLWTAVVGAGAGLWCSPTAGVAAAGTAVAWAAAARRPRWHLAAAGALVAAVAIQCRVSGHPSHAALGGQEGAAGPSGTQESVWAALLAWVAVGVFLAGPANELCRSLFALLMPVPPGSRATSRTHGGSVAGQTTTAYPGPVSGRGRWRLRLLGREVASVDASAPEGPADLMGGGRLIGVLERMLVVVLALSGMAPALAAVAAAKGIVRFPEISEDRATGAKAEEFLVGSLGSWSIAAAGTAYLALG